MLRSLVLIGLALVFVVKSLQPPRAVADPAQFLPLGTVKVLESRITGPTSGREGW